MKSSTASELLFVDTWGWLVLANSKDPDNPQVLDLRVEFANRGLPWVTSDYVLDETLTRLFASTPFTHARHFIELIFDAQSVGSLIIETIGPDRFQSAWKLRIRYKDKPRISFTDLTSFVVMRKLGSRTDLTGDAHFSQLGLSFQTLPSPGSRVT